MFLGQHGGALVCNVSLQQEDSRLKSRWSLRIFLYGWLSLSISVLLKSKDIYLNR